MITCEADRSQAVAEKYAAAWRARGFSGAFVVHKSQYNSLTGDKNWWVVCPGSGSYNAMRNLLPQVKGYYADAYGIKADQSSNREIFE